MNTISFVIPGVPITKKNHNRRIQRGKRVFTVPSEAYEKWNKAAIEPLRSKMAEWTSTIGLAFPLTAEMTMSCTVYRGARRGDLVNYIQAIQDTLQDAGVVEDDKFIVRLDDCVLGLDYEHPRVVIELTF